LDTDTKRTAVVLAGGRSCRFGQDKAFFMIRGKPMVKIIIDILGSDFDEVIIAGGDMEKSQEHGLVCYPDPVPDKGALGGIYNGLIHSNSQFIFCCGCDMPLIKPDVIRVILDNISDEDVLMPVINNKRQPLHAVYKKSLLPLVERLVNSSDRFLPDLFERAKVRYLDECHFSKLPGYDLSFVSFDDLNAVAQYRSHLEKL